jgi:hypothetical protein
MSDDQVFDSTSARALGARLMAPDLIVCHRRLKTDPLSPK